MRTGYSSHSTDKRSNALDDDDGLAQVPPTLVLRELLINERLFGAEVAAALPDEGVEVTSESVDLNR